ncbi:MAG TPA: AbrB/MazE/SpoVT family DNA-binding domain-containing protein [Candidatus Saccharimonadales bacterium]|nr:AbrB/MazE/SpoVT family DNA-binding domain-containing protein [Candidatus Saccharimonadales bacterium]
MLDPARVVGDAFGPSISLFAPLTMSHYLLCKRDYIFYRYELMHNLSYDAAYFEVVVFTNFKFTKHFSSYILKGMNNVKLSSNYQVVIPKAVRQKLGLRKGQTLYVECVTEDAVALTTKSPVDKYYGILKGVWAEDAVDYQRHARRDRELPGL